MGLPSFKNRTLCVSLARVIRARMTLEVSKNFAAAASWESSRTSTSGTSTWISKRSSMGPETRFWYFCISRGVQLHAFFVWFKYPHGHGFELEKGVQLY